MARRTFLSEAELQMQVVALLTAYGRHDICVFHAANGEERNKATAARLKKMGVVPGVADLILIVEGRCYGVELKTEVGAQRSRQSDWQERFERAGGSYHLAKGLMKPLACCSALTPSVPASHSTTNSVGVWCAPRPRRA